MIARKTNFFIKTYLILILVLLATMFVNTDTISTINYLNDNNFSINESQINPIDNERFENSKNIFKDKSNHFRKNNGLFNDDTTLFFVQTTKSLIKFKQSSFVITVSDQNINKSYTINLTLFNANTVNPIGLKRTEYSTVLYHDINTITSIYDYSELYYINIFDNIDLKFFFEDGGLKYNFIVHRGGNPDNIVFKVETDLIFNLSTRSIQFLSPDNPKVSIFSDEDLFTFQNTNNLVDSYFTKKYSNSCTTCYGFSISSYNHQEDLIIDPYWIISDENILLNQSYHNIQANGFVFDSSDNIIILGCILSNSVCDSIYVAKYSETGTLMKIVYINGSSNDGIEIEERGRSTSKSISIDDNDNIFITGYTSSTNFYIKNAYQIKNNGGEDAFFVKLNDNLVIEYSSYFGGEGNDRGRAIEEYNNQLFLAGITESVNLTTKNSLQKNFNGGLRDSFLAKFSEPNNLVFSSYWGGNLDDEVHTLKVDRTGDVIIAGHTTSNKFNVTEVALQTTIGSEGSIYPDAFISKISNDGQSVVFSTYFGGKNSDDINDILVYPNGEIIVLGSTSSETIDDRKPDKIYVNPDGDLYYSRVFLLTINEGGYNIINYIISGGNGNDYGLAAEFYNTNNIVITGNTLSTNFWDGKTIHTFEPNTLSHSFITEINNQTLLKGMSSRLYSNCTYVDCNFMSQDIQVNHNNSIFLLGNNRIAGENFTNFGWTPFLIEISSQDDIMEPDIAIRDYKIENTYSPKSNLSIVVNDNESGVNKIEYKWSNESYQVLSAPFYLTLPNKSGTYELTLQAIDNAGNIGTNSFKITVTGTDYSSMIIIGVSIVFSIITAYITIYMFWKYYFSKKRAIKNTNLKADDLNDYMKLLNKNKDLMEELEETKEL